jgi:hypothetical protein
VTCDRKNVTVRTAAELGRPTHLLRHSAVGVFTFTLPELIIG